MSCGADPTLRDESGRSAYEWALLQHRVAVVSRDRFQVGGALQALQALFGGWCGWQGEEYRGVQGEGLAGVEGSFLADTPPPPPLWGL